ncbi:hypothetical protein [Rossellomorea vietnamensis]|uniref:Uncharacterized protein n=1 Tax=Rossellomorea vietnamensis TaxID=218284 RepID=A0A0P6VXW9_9BACI|nr:hypothetical protein [Rossellomorea vietnamensis]KPL57677.1 hypothetical protein AM506_20955 [Rossellomorea vietnamensis]
MTKLNEIQRKILMMNAANFQKLVDTYLVATGYRNITSLGSVVGSESTRKGTPDAYFVLNNGKYVFVEYTVQKEGLYKKIRSDLHKCLDETFTGIERAKIQEIIYCHTAQLYPKELEELNYLLEQHNIRLRIIGIDQLSQDLYQKYPRIAKEFLNVNIDTGQIVTMEDFVSIYDKNAMATPLGINFHFREEELSSVLCSLQENDVVTVSGKAGTGKTRLVLEACRSYINANHTTKLLCVKNNGQSLYEDLLVYLHEQGDYLLLIDDANQTTSLDIILEYLHEKDSGKRVKVIATVRDYALDKVLEKVEEHTIAKQIKIEKLKDEEIREIVSKEFNITNSLYLERIESIAQGNPRLAVMAASIAKRESTFESISDTTQLLDQYFTNIRKDLDDLNDNNFLKVAGIISFLNNINLNDTENLKSLCKISQINEDVFNSIITRLGELEIVDIYDNQVAKVSDQILSTYLLYLSIIDKKILPLSALIDKYFPEMKNRIVETVNSLNNHFNSQRTHRMLEAEIKALWNHYKGKNDSRFEDYMLTFWIFNKTETLLYIKQCIDDMEYEPFENNFIISNNYSNEPPPIIQTLIQYRYTDEHLMALDLIFDYLSKKTNEFQLIYSIIVKKFGINQHSHRRNYFVQNYVISRLKEKANNWSDEILTMMFIRVSTHFLKYSFEHTEAKGYRGIVIHNITLIANDGCIEYRTKIWINLIELLNANKYKREVIHLLNAIRINSDVAQEIIEIDKYYIAKIIREKLNQASFEHCLLVNKLFKSFKRVGIKLIDDVESYQSDRYKIYSIIKGERKFREDYREAEEQKRNSIREWIKDFTLIDFEKLFEDIRYIHETIEEESYEIVDGMNKLFSVLIEVQADLSEITKIYLNMNLKLDVHPNQIIEYLITTQGLDQTEQIIRQQDYYNKSNWLFSFFSLIPKNQISQKYLDSLYKHFNEPSTDSTGWYHDLSFLENYMQIDGNVFVNVTEILLQGNENEKRKFFLCMSLIFNPHTELRKKLFSLFNGKLSTLKNAYFEMLKIDSYRDYDSSFLIDFMKYDESILFDYIDFQFSVNGQYYLQSDSINLNFIWPLENYYNLVSKAFNYILKKTQDNIFLRGQYIDELFKFEEIDENSRLKNNQNQWIKDYMKHNRTAEEAIETLFYAVASFDNHRKKELIEYWLMQNKSFELFEKLNFQPLSGSWSGSEIPWLVQRRSFYESLRPILNGLDYLKHRQHIEEIISEIDKRIQKVKLEEFVNDY